MDVLGVLEYSTAGEKASTRKTLTATRLPQDFERKTMSMEASLAADNKHI